ncbi:MAG: hypothetical protein JXB07_16430 [Anaerolineae bacterium]|nr:hypothetical protein [Anaerolineae bacterium]
MTPDKVVTQVWQIVEDNPGASEDEFYQLLADAGIPDATADRCYKLAQVAWGRAFLDGLGIDFSDDYLCLDARGDLVESGRLSEEPYFTAAAQLAEKYAVSPAMRQIALCSAEVHAVNDALNAGSNPQDLSTGPTCMFVEAPTDEGMEKARHTIMEYMNK